MIICVLKASLPIESIRRVVAESMRPDAEDAFYDAFCESFELSVRHSAEAALARTESESSPITPLCRAALRAQAEQALALALYEATAGEREKKEKK